jgi:GntR family transcriptional regulator
VSAEAARPAFESRFGAALAALRREITLGRYKDSDMLPGERDLSDLLGISRTTVRRVLSVLVDDGLLTHRHGVGTFVRPAPAAGPQPAARLAGFSEAMRLQGRVPSSREVECCRALPSAEEAMMLACHPAQSVARLSRLRCADGVAVAIEQAVVPGGFLDRPEEIGDSLYAALARRGFPPMRALQRVRGTIAGQADAERLGIAAGSTAILVHRTAYLADGRCCAFTRATCRADCYDVVWELRPPHRAGGDDPE